MTARRTVGRASLVALVSALLLSGCSSATGPDATVDPGRDGPLAQYLTALGGDELSDEQQQAQDADVEEAIAACMADEGFDYRPVSNDDPFYRPGEWRPDDVEWVARWGYGTVDFPGKREMLAAQAAGDENAAYYASLSGSEQAAYSDTLYGPAPTDAEIAASLDGSDLITWDEQGCWGRGRHEVVGESPLDDGRHLALRQAIVDLRATRFVAPEYAELNAAWAECMADAGHAGFEAQPDAAESIYEQMTAVYSSQTDSDEDDPRLLALHDDEVELALADLECRRQTDYAARALVIQYAQEDRFIADHRSELDQLMADADQGR